MNDIETSSEFQALRELSARIGQDLWQVQGAGGNTSLKEDETLWIKASGRWLANAANTNIFVPVALEPLMSALTAGDLSAENSISFVRQELNSEQLRPSIETTVHAVLPQKVVIHIHCVDTIALAVRKDAEDVLAKILADFKWLWVPYFRPGLPLSRYISAYYESGTDVIVLGNHGLVVAADTVDQAAALLERVRTAVKQTARNGSTPDLDLLEKMTDGAPYLPSQCKQTHAIAFDKTAVNVAAAGSLYPDHVIFLGEGTHVLENAQQSHEVLEQHQNLSDALPVSIVVPQAGVLMHENANASQHAMARCISDVCLRVTDMQSVNYLTDEETYQLLHWEAETYRQTIAT